MEAQTQVQVAQLQRQLAAHFTIMQAPNNNTYYTSNGATAGTGISYQNNYGARIFISTGALRANSVSTSASNYMTDLTLTFNRPVNTPNIHFSGFGGSTSSMGFTGEYELVEVNGVAVSGTVVTKLSGSITFALSGNKVTSQAASYTSTNNAFGSVSVYANSVTSLKFKVYIKGDGTTNTTGWSASGGTDSGEQMTISVSTPTLTPDLSVTNTVSSSTAYIGTQVTFTITATNGVGSATNVNVSDLLPSGFTYVSSTASSGTYNPSTGQWAIGTMAEGAKQTLAIVAQVNSSGNYTKTASITGTVQGGTESNTTNNTASATVTAQSAPDYCDNPALPVATTSGSGNYKSQLVFFNWGSKNLADKPSTSTTVNGITYTATVTDYKLVKGSVSTAYRGYDIKTWYNANTGSSYVGNAMLYNVSGYNEGFYGSVSTTANQSTEIQATISVVASKGGSPYPFAKFDIVGFDMEATALNQELFKMTSNGPITLLEAYGGGPSSVTGVGTNTVTINNSQTSSTTSTYGNALYVAVGKNSMTFNVTSGNQGAQGFGAAIRLYCAECYYVQSNNLGPALPTQHGITSLQRGGKDNGNWPMVRTGAWTALESKTLPFVVTRMTTAQINSINTPQEGMMTYDTDVKCLKIYSDNKWTCFQKPACQ